MTVDSKVVSIPSLVEKLVASEKDENNNLIQILGIVRPTKSSQTGITSIIRGLFTKNKNLLQTLNNYASQLPSLSENDQRQLFKSFISEFVLWCQDDVLLLFEKYHKCLANYEFNDKNSEDLESFAMPINHLVHYVNFICDTLVIVKNPYIVEALAQFSQGCASILEQFDLKRRQSDLVNIDFNNVKIFGESSSSEKVCSYFKTEQIVQRTTGHTLTYCHATEKSLSVELLLLNLGGFSKADFNALAVVGIPQNGSSRYLIYPPFRVNELLLTYSQSQSRLIFKSINFVSSDDASKRDTITIICPDQSFLLEWIAKLSVIFPLEKSDSPMSPGFALKDSPADVRMNGLGIDMLSDSSQISSEEEPFAFMVQAPSPVPDHLHLKAPQPLYSAATNMESPCSLEDFKQPRIPQFVHKSRASSTSTVSSFARSETSSDAHADARRSSLELMQKTLSHNSNAALKNVNCVQPVERADPIEQSESKRPVSETVEIESNSGAAVPSREPSIRSNALLSPVHVDATTKGNLYKLTTGSEVDISNFGKTHNPSFSVHRGLSELQETPKSRFFGLFKRKSKTKLTQDSKNNQHGTIASTKAPALSVQLPSATPKVTKTPALPKLPKPRNLTINTGTTDVDSDNTIPLSATSAMSSNSTLSRGDGARTITTHKNSSGSAFALPSSTSTYFFKPAMKGSTQNDSSISLVEEDQTLDVPQTLKDQINDESTEEFFMSAPSPKNMKVSKWKPKCGKWEMLTVNENIFLRIVVNYEANKAWLIAFKEEVDKDLNEEVDVPIILLDILAETELTQSSALDVQISSKNSVTGETVLIMIRCCTAELAVGVVSNIKNIKSVLYPRGLRHKYSAGSLGASRQTIASSVMEGRSNTSKSSTMTSMSSVGQMSKQQLSAKPSINSISTQENTKAGVLSNPNNSKMVLMSNMKIRLQKQLESYESINVPSSWVIVAMFTLTVSVISDSSTGKNYYSFHLDNGTEDESYNWAVSEDEKFDRFERIGKAGLLVKLKPNELYMIECKGKKALKELLEVL